MNVSFNLNGDEVAAIAPAIERLSSLLHDRFGLLSVRSGCLSGRCGSCLVFMDDKLVNACLVPAFRARKTKIVTFEAFSKTKGYADIEQGFKKAGVETCGYCYAGKALSAESIIASSQENDTERIAAGLSGCVCRCTEIQDLVKGVEFARECRRERSYGVEP
jgi:aerobic carbon-monoxide dehydrogenase small subunit